MIGETHGLDIVRKNLISDSDLYGVSKLLLPWGPSPMSHRKNVGEFSLAFRHDHVISLPSLLLALSSSYCILKDSVPCHDYATCE